MGLEAALTFPSVPRWITPKENWKLNQSHTWFALEPRLEFNRIVVVRYRMYLEFRRLAANTINQQLAAVRRLAHEAADAGLLSPAGGRNQPCERRETTRAAFGQRPEFGANLGRKRTRPEYQELAARDWKTAGDRTYAEVRYLRDAALAEAAVRRLVIILEISGDEHSVQVVDILKHGGYEVSVEYVHCSPEEEEDSAAGKHKSHSRRQPLVFTTEPEFLDKYEYQNGDVNTFRREYERLEWSRPVAVLVTTREHL